MSDLPKAVWSGAIMGVKVHVLDDGRRIIDADDLENLFERIGSGEVDALEFATAYRRFEARPLSGTDGGTK